MTDVDGQHDARWLDELIWSAKFTSVHSHRVLRELEEWLAARGVQLEPTVIAYTFIRYDLTIRYLTPRQVLDRIAELEHMEWEYSPATRRVVFWPEDATDRTEEHHQ